MARDNTRPSSCLIAVGEPGGALVQTLVQLACEREIDAVPCENAYAAVVAMARAAGWRVLVVGPMRELAVENGAFFGISAAHGVSCCCLVDPGRVAGSRGLLAALRANATIVGAAPEVRSVLQDWLATAEPRTAPRHGRDAPHTKRPVREETYDDLRATEAELSALLG